MHTPALEGAVAAVGGVEKAREEEVLILEELKHQAMVQIIRRLGNSVENWRLGKMRRHAVSWICATRRGKSAGGAGPSLRETIAHGRLRIWIKESSNDTIGGVTTRSGKIR